MKILACSDVGSYEGLIEILDKTNPDLLLLAGDLTSDGRAEFWPLDLEWVDGRIVDTPELKSRRAIHVENFYKILKHASLSGTIFVVKGDHDDDFEGDYDVERINSIRNCHEISGKLTTFHNIRILGLGYHETHYLRTLRPLIEKMKDKVNILLTHAESRRMPLISQIKPKLIIRGHFGLGRYKVSEISVVSPLFPNCYAIIKTQDDVIEVIDSWCYCTRTKEWEKCNYSCNFSDRAIRARRSLWTWYDRTVENCPFGYDKHFYLDTGKPAKENIKRRRIYSQTSLQNSKAKNKTQMKLGRGSEDDAIVFLAKILSHNQKERIRVEIESDPNFAQKQRLSLGMEIRNALRAGDFFFGSRRMDSKWFSWLKCAIYVPEDEIILTDSIKERIKRYEEKRKYLLRHAPDSVLLGLKRALEAGVLKAEDRNFLPGALSILLTSVKAG